MALDEVVGGGDEFGLELVGGFEQGVFGVGGAALAFGAAAAKEILAAKLGLADAEGVGGVDIFNEQLVALADGFEGAEEELGLVEEDDDYTFTQSLRLLEFHKPTTREETPGHSQVASCRAAAADSNVHEADLRISRADQLIKTHPTITAPAGTGAGKRANTHPSTRRTSLTTAPYACSVIKLNCDCRATSSTPVTVSPVP